MPDFVRVIRIFREGNACDSVLIDRGGRPTRPTPSEKKGPATSFDRTA